MNSVNNLVKILMVALLGLSTVVGQPSAPKFLDQFGHVPCEDLRSRLDLLLAEISNSPGAQGVIVYYDGKFADYKGGRWRKVLPVFGEVHQMMRLFRVHFGFRRFDLNRITFISGGYQEDYNVEFWLVPLGGKFPAVKPTRETMQYRNGQPTPIGECH